jgi:hypothetical protein
VPSSLTPCPGCGRDTQTLEDGRCHYCGQLKPLTADIPATPSTPPPSTLEDLRPQLIAVAVAALLAVLGFLAGSTLLLVIAAVVLLASAVAKIVADGW